MYDLGKVRPRRGYSYKKDDRTGKKKKKKIKLCRSCRVASRRVDGLGVSVMPTYPTLPGALTQDTTGPTFPSDPWGLSGLCVYDLIPVPWTVLQLRSTSSASGVGKVRQERRSSPAMGG
jgi:hypothetical protein